MREQRLQDRVDPADGVQVLGENRPPGFRSAMSGVRFATRAKSSSVKRMPASCAIAGMCSAALVEPPVAATAAQAFSRLFCVTSSRGSGPPFVQELHDALCSACVRAPRFAAQPPAASPSREAPGPASRTPSPWCWRVNCPGQEPERRHAHALELIELACAHAAREHRADRLVGVEHGDVAALPAAGQRGAAVDEHRRAG